MSTNSKSSKYSEKSSLDLVSELDFLYKELSRASTDGTRLIPTIREIHHELIERRIKSYASDEQYAQAQPIPFTSATALAEAGYDAQAVIEKLPEIIAQLSALYCVAGTVNFSSHNQMREAIEATVDTLGKILSPLEI